MRRRQVLAAVALGGAGALAGCQGPQRASLELQVGDEDAIASAYATRHRRLSRRARPIAADAVENGTATASGAEPPYDPGNALGYEGSFYEVTYEVVDRTPATAYRVAVDYDVDSLRDGSPVVRVADLPDVDRQKVGAILTIRGDADNAGADNWLQVRYTDAEAAQSVLVPDPRYAAVVYEGEPIRVHVADEGSVERKRYRYSARRIAADRSELAAQVHERYRFELAALTDAQRRIWRSAREDEYAEEDPSRAFRDLVERFREHEPMTGGDDDWYATWLVEYDGTIYLAQVETPPTWRDATVARETPTEF